MQKNICCFAGHRDIHDFSVKDHIQNAAVDLIENHGVTEFWVGRYGDFDQYATDVVRELKRSYADIQLNLVIPYLTKAIDEQKELYYQQYDHIIMADMPENTPKKYRIIRANQFMVQNAAYLICYVTYSWGGAAQTLAYAEKKEHIAIFNIGLNRSK